MNKISRYLIKLLGGISKDEIHILDKYKCLTKEECDTFNILYNGTDIAMMRSVGVKFIEDINHPAIVINLSKRNGLELLKNNKTIKVIQEILSNEKTFFYQETLSTKFK